MSSENRSAMAAKGAEGIRTSSLTTLGRCAFNVNGISAPIPPTRKARALMAYLVMHRDADTARDALVEIFWPDADPDRARDNLSTALSSIRRCLRTAGLQADELIIANYSVVRWTADTLVDAQQFAELSAQDDPAANAEALHLYRGDFLEGDYDHWSTGERERLASLYEAVLARAVRISRDPEAARCLIARNPYAEDGYVVLLETELHAGRSASAVSLVDQLRKALAEIGEKPSEAFEERFGYIKQRALDMPTNNLPRQTTSFVGREVELGEVKALIATGQLVTIVGAGGVGKTRVALQAGTELFETFDDGVWFADLAKVSEADSVIPELASAFSVTSHGFRALFDHVLAYLKHKHLLLVIDNCEHVVDEAARVVDQISTACPHVTILATSRENLGARGERVYLLPSLNLPPPHEEPAAEDVAGFSAVALFVDRAVASDAHFVFSDDKAGVIVEICRRLDGIALAIELAAARVRTLSVHQLLERLREQFRLLTGGGRVAHPRHQTMRAALDWSYEWLSETEKAMFRRLAIFQGGWMIEAVPGISDDDSLDELSVLDNLSSLVNKSLVAVEFSGQSQRYRLMEPLRQYGLERLKEHLESDYAGRSHARYFAELVRQAADKVRKVPGEVAWLAHIEEEIDNIRAALEWSLLRRNDPVLGAQIAENLGAFWFSRHYHEGLRWLELAQAAVTYEDYPTLSIGIAVARVRSYMVASTSATLRVCEESLARARTVSDELHLRRLLMFYGVTLVGANRIDEAEAAAKESLDSAERANDPYRVVFNLWTLARVNRRRGKFDVARNLSIRMAQVYEALHLPHDRNRWPILIERARCEQLDGDLARAIELCREAHAEALLTRDPLGDVHAEYFLATLLFMSGAVSEARDHGRALLKLSLDELLPHGITFALQVLAGVATDRAEHAIAAELLGYAELRFREQPLVRDAFVDVDPDLFIQPLRDHFGEGRLAELVAEGERWSEDQAIEEALKI
jgi:predicted ATPase/DNA-binding SARP family transcriptional activator